MKKLLYTSFIILALFVTAMLPVNDLSVEAAAVNPFTDVKDSNSHAKAILSLYNDGIITGTSTTTYEPGKSATRGEAALFLANALGLQENTEKNGTFKDVPSSSIYYQAVTALTKAGIVNGYGDEFKPNTTLTRAQLSKMLTIGFELHQSTQTKTKFTDVNKLTDGATKQYIQTLVDYGITKGTTATTFSPNMKLTRGQLATFLFNAINVASDELTVISVE
ncbi:S-layer homology domain-containing protein [Solibacillus merdavium]|uniref:S-layer homology domain-containing protein n=1 Tax=Solibacillus merdavium TaxID=2762218 RepID=A0ABR8XHL0_9BACL|nr:S-layer homology domain-containing protein [Solibacillus merdavium]MBD8031431.1 S-layer homology domain-containing protein [Solibacillus merdavium]